MRRAGYKRKLMRSLTIELDRDQAAPARARTMIRGLKPLLGTERMEDATLLVSELVTNAVKYGRSADQQARVKVVFKRQDQDKWVLSVEDNGPGIPPDAEKGRSIGMRLIRSLATQLGGALEVASSPAGSRFSIHGAMVRAETPL